METYLTYNSVNPFLNVGPTPFFSKSDQMVTYHDRWCVATQLTLQGLVSGTCGDFDSLMANQRRLINNFSQDYKSLQVIENNQVIESFNYATVESISFEQDKYVRIVPYTITLNCYKQNLFSGTYGVLDPVNNISYQEGEDSIITATRTISARGFNTSSSNYTNDGLTNAINYVQSKTGWNPANYSLPYFITYNTALIAPCLREQKENIDRFNNTYEINETYTWNKFASSSTIVKYSVDSNYDENAGLYSVQVQGTIEGCPEDDIANIRSIYSTLNLYSIANFEFHKSFPSAPPLNPEYLNDSVDENTDKRILSFSRSYDTDTRSPIMFDYEFSVNYNVLSDIHTISLNGVIRSRNSQKTKWDRVLAYYQALNIFSLVQDFYIQNGYPDALVSYPTAYSVNEDEFAGEIKIQVTYNNGKQPEPGFDKFSYTINVEPSINTFLPVPKICGSYVIINLNSLRRAKISINGESFSLSNIDKSGAVRTIAKSILNQYIETPALNRVIKSDRISQKNEAQGISYNVDYSESYGGKAFPIS